MYIYRSVKNLDGPVKVMWSSNNGEGQRNVYLKMRVLLLFVRQALPESEEI
jgi:hypothetical protein